MNPLISVSKYLSLVKFSHTVFAMPFAMIGFFIAISFTDSTFNWMTFLLVIMCMVFARNAAMGFNRFADKEIDIRNPRTAKREIPAGAIGSVSVLIFVIVNVILFILATYFINRLTFFLSPVAILIILGYSLTKKFTSLCHFILGVGLSLAPIGAYIAVTGRFALVPLFYSVVVLLWVSGFDIIYALQDEDFDRRENLKSIPALVGKKQALFISSILHLLSSVFVILAGIVSNFGILYWSGSAIFIGMLLYQHTLVRPDDLSRVNIAFFTTNGIASIIFSLFVILELFL